MSFKYEVGDLVKVYEGTHLANDGVIGLVIERSVHDQQYAIAPIEEVVKADEKVRTGKITANDKSILLMAEHSLWARNEDLESIDFTRPKLNLLPILVNVLCFSIGLGVMYYVY